MPLTTLIAPADLEPHLDDPGWVVFDCRHQLSDTTYGERAYAEGHIPGARLADMDRDLAGPVGAGTGRHPLPDRAAFADWLGVQGVGEGTQVVVYDDVGGVMASRLWWMLRALGHTAVAVLDGGFPRWQREGRPVTAEVPQPAPATFTARPDAAAEATLEQVMAAVEGGDAVLVDARGPDRYEGKTEPIDPVAGHIPGARNHPFAGNLGPEGTLLPPETLRERLLATFGGAAPERTVHYCGSGVSACHNLLAMAHAGLPSGRLYVGSWSQWCADPQRPIETGPARDSH